MRANDAAPVSTIGGWQELVEIVVATEDMRHGAIVRTRGARQPGLVVHVGLVCVERCSVKTMDSARSRRAGTIPG